MLCDVADDLTLAALGLDLEDEAQQGVRTDCIPLARRLARADKRIIGLLPASPAIGILAVGVQLGLALTEVATGAIGYTDANIRWPAISRLVASLEPEDDSLLAVRWLGARLALLSPPCAGDAGAGVPQLARTIQSSVDRFTHLLVDLTGFKELGEHLAAIDMMDAVVVVARAGLTRETDLLRLDFELPRALNFGVVLTGAAAPCDL